MTESVKPCPFCGGPPRLYGPNGAGETFVSCLKDGCFGSDFVNGRGAFQVRLDVWNSRIEPSIRDTPKFRALMRLSNVEALLREVKTDLKGIHADVLRADSLSPTEGK